MVHVTYREMIFTLIFIVRVQWYSNKLKSNMHAYYIYLYVYPLIPRLCYIGLTFFYSIIYVYTYIYCFILFICKPNKPYICMHDVL